MRKRTALILSIAVFSLWACGSARATVHVGEIAPSFKLKTPTDQAFDPATLDGKVSIIIFWRLNQSFSIEALTDLQLVYEEFRSDGLEIVGICTGTTENEAVKATIDELGITFTVLLDPQRTTYADFGIFVSPATCLLDRDRRIRFYRPGHSSEFIEATRLDAALLLEKISAQTHANRLKTRPKISRAADSSDAKYKLGLELLRRDNLEGAKAVLRQAWEGEVKSVLAAITLGMILLDEKNNDEALAILTEATEMAPNMAHAQGARAIALIRTGHTDEGLALLERILREHPDEPYLYYELGRLREKEGQHVEAMTLFKRGLELTLDR